MQVIDIVELYDGQKVKIGMAEGSSFVWIGTVSDMLPGELMDVWREFKRLYDTRIHNYQKRISRAEEQIRKFNRESLFYQATLEEIKHLKENLAETKNCRKKCTNILRREVVKQYPSISESNTMIFIVEGKEMGHAWNLEEWTAWNGRKAKKTN